MRLLAVLIGLFLALAFVSVACAIGGSVQNKYDGLAPRPTHHFTFGPTSDATTAPSRGGSTATFTRATASTRYSAAALAAVTSGTAVIGQNLDGSCCGGSPLTGSHTLDTTNPYGFYVGNAATFVLLRNEEIDNAAWADVNTPVVTANDASPTDPAGGTTSELVDDNDATNIECRRQTVTVADNSTSWAATAWVRCDSAHSVRLRLSLTGGVTPTDESNTITCSATDWTRLSLVTANNGTGNTSAVVDVCPTSATGSDTGTANFWRPELVNFAYSFQIDPLVVASSVAVNADALSYATVSVGDTGTVCAWVYTTRNTGNVGGLFAWDNTNAHIAVETQTDQTFRLLTTKRVDNADVISTTLVANNQWEHVCATWNQTAADINLYLNGAEMSYSATNDQAWTASGDYGTTLKVGDSSAGTPTSPEGFISDFMFWNGRALTTAQILRVYNRSRGRYE